MSVTLTFDDGGLILGLQNAPQVLGVHVQKGMTNVCLHLVGAVQRNISQGGLIGRRTGNLARAIRFEVIPGANGIIGTVWPDPDKAIYGSINEDGGVITAHGGALTIPLEAMLTGNGVPRGTAGQVKANPGAFGFSGSFIPKGHEVIMGTIAGSKEIVPLFALKQSVTLPGRHYLATTLIQETTAIADIFERTLGDAVSVIFGEAAA